MNLGTIFRTSRPLRSVIFLWVCVFIHPAQRDGYAQPKTLTILNTNDIHASFLPHEAYWMRSDPKPMVGGFYELWWMVDSVRRARGPVLLLDAGDVMTGTPISEIEYKGVTGGALFEMMNLTGYDAWTIGNHDLDISQDNLRRLAGIQKCPTVSANLTDTAGAFPFQNKAYVIIERGGLRVGIIGLMSRDLFHLTNTKNLTGLKVLSPSEVTQRIIDKIRPETDLIVALSHEGVDDDSILAVSTHGLGVIIGGHSHTRLKTPKLINGVIICQAGSNCENLGELSLTVSDHQVTNFDGKLLQLWARHPVAKNDLTKLIDEFKSKIDREYGEVIGTLSTDWKRGGSAESNVGNFVADATREGAGADLGVTNSSGIRNDLHAGPITKLGLFEIMPFRNTLCTFRISGADLRALARRYLESLIDHKASIQLSGINCTWKRGNGGPEIQQLAVQGKEVSDASEYTCATSDFVVNQSDKYLGMTLPSVTYLPTTVYQAIVAKVRREKIINSRIENRFQETQ